MQVVKLQCLGMMGMFMAFSPMDHSLSYVGRRFEEEHEWSRADVSTDDGNIYAANQYGQI